MAFVLDVSQALRYPGQSYPFVSALGDADYDVSGDPVGFREVSAEGEYFAGGSTVSMKARVKARVLARCDRCLKDIEYPAEAEFDVKFAPDAGDDPDIYPLDGHRVALDAPAMDALLLGLPMKFLCSESCRGLCPVCGHDLNEGPCACQEGDT